ncbi:type I-C CRISPR-associated protein Cas8c/Csd1 [Aquabacterium sp.]|uniref:type I-C CRISPR-associated protein Cas8c/Csd1 n=1 Tax=Aquabacterium sp. TaxID=1872578 RepID=UPI0025B91011|nr:type I-C CRISPR-associated protein Cas8c/Csd1 [Aquabacterium sp.]
MNDYYLRKMSEPDPAKRLPVFGFEDKEIPFILELSADGLLVGIKDTRIIEGKKNIAAKYLVPQGVKKTSGIASNLLWDNAEYVLGLPDVKKHADAEKKGKGDEYAARLLDMRAAFKKQIASLPDGAQSDEGIRAVLAFLDADPVAAVALHPAAAEIAETNPTLSFRLAGDVDLVCQRPAVTAVGHGSQAGEVNSGEPVVGKPAACLVTGLIAEPERLHTAIKGVWGAQTSGANIVSFNLDAFKSFGKDQGANAPVSPEAAFAYTTALNHLLARGSRQRIQVGDASTVFWAQKQEDADFEPWFADLFGESDDPDKRTDQVRALFEAIKTGRFDGARGENKFFVLGLAPNAARIAIRFWQVSTLAEIAQRTRQWFDDLRVARAPNEPEYPSLFRLLAATALLNKADNIPPNLGGEVMRSALNGAPLPATWLNAAVQRCRAEQRVTYLRAAVLKACINRSIRHANRTSTNPEKEITEVLDTSNPSVGYRLGRLFAALERTQEEASPGLNATIRDRYYGAASSTPVAVFTTLLRLKNHHIAKIGNKGRAFNLEKLMGEIVDGIGDFPSHMPLQEQGRFALGYYHQRQAFFTKTETEQPNQGGN